MCDSLDSLDVFALFFFFFTLVGLAECKKVSLVVLSDFFGAGPKKSKLQGAAVNIIYEAIVTNFFHHC